MKSERDLAEFIAAQPQMVRTLETVAALSLPDCWIGAGFIRNAVWDKLHGRDYADPTGDVDVVFFDLSSASLEPEGELESTLKSFDAKLDWSVKNQARMHLGNGDAPYRDTADAMAHWPETCTAIGARLRLGMIDIAAPFGLDDLLNLRVRASPHFRTKMQVYRARIVAKQWSKRWPRLDIET